MSGVPEGLKDSSKPALPAEFYQKLLPSVRKLVIPYLKLSDPEWRHTYGEAVDRVRLEKAEELNSVILIGLSDYLEFDVSTYSVATLFFGSFGL